MLIIEDQAYYDAVLAFARSVGAEKLLKAPLDYLATYACDGDREKTRCRLAKDFADHSFRFVMEKRDPDAPDGYVPWFNGGLVYSGPGQPLNGSFPALVVSLNPDEATGRTHMWSVHT